MRQGLLLMSLMALTVVLASGAALALAPLYCPNDTGGLCYGTEKPDTMYGRPTGPDYMYARGGADIMHGYEGADYLQGDSGEDKLYGGNGDDELYGGGGPPSNPTDRSGDKAYGGNGDDYIYSGFAKGGVDRVFGGKGNDTVEAQRDYGFPTTIDIVDCGSGTNDTVYFDEWLDKVKNCENKIPSRSWLQQASSPSSWRAQPPDSLTRGLGPRVSAAPELSHSP